MELKEYNELKEGDVVELYTWNELRSILSTIGERDKEYFSITCNSTWGRRQDELLPSDRKVTIHNLETQDRYASFKLDGASNQVVIRAMIKRKIDTPLYIVIHFDYMKSTQFDNKEALLLFLNSLIDVTEKKLDDLNILIFDNNKNAIDLARFKAITTLTFE